MIGRVYVLEAPHMTTVIYLQTRSGLNQARDAYTSLCTNVKHHEDQASLEWQCRAVFHVCTNILEKISMLASSRQHWGGPYLYILFLNTVFISSLGVRQIPLHV